jgi:hypothetical protein
MEEEIEKIRPKFMDINYFRSFGYLQEVNRRFFHPLGLALEVQIDDDGNETLGRVWDYRDDPEGIVFVPGPDHKKWLNVETEIQTRAIPRQKALGYEIQPVEKPVLDTTEV